MIIFIAFRNRHRKVVNKFDTIIALSPHSEVSPFPVPCHFYLISDEATFPMVALFSP